MKRNPCFSRIWLVIFSIISSLLGVSEAYANFPPHNLTQQQATLRFSQINQVHYTIELWLNKTGLYFKGDTQLTFNWKGSEKPLSIDFYRGNITSMTLNNAPTKDYTYNGQSIIIPDAKLKLGKNTIDIAYNQAYTKDATGLYRFKDPEDKRVYLYTQFEVFDANKMFPCFDQPDLKANYRLTVHAPSNWKIISTVRENKIEHNKQSNTWYFPITPLISTYVFSLHAGDYKVWKDDTGAIPLRLFARQTLARYVDSKLWFSITHKGFKYFNKYFNYRYPFLKYDQLIVPDFNMGAMENVAAVTFRELLVPRGKMQPSLQAKLTELIYHEMAHMWFGNLVTMKWWNDLWLNESFANYMGKDTAQRLNAKNSTLVRDFITEKTTVYTADDSLTSHPILANIPNTLSSEANFDSITYGKGEAALRQLIYYIGKKPFQDAIRFYTLKHAYENTDLTDFSSALNKYTNKNMPAYIDKWFNTTGYNSISIQHRCEKGLLQSITIKQGNRPLRTHKALLGLYREDHNAINRYITIPVIYQNSSTPINVSRKNIACPDFIFNNEGDFDYAQPIYNTNQLAFIRNNLSKMPNLVKAQIIFSLLQLTKDAKYITVREFDNLIFKEVLNEQNPDILSMSLGMLQSTYNYYPRSQRSELSKLKKNISMAVWIRLLKSKPDSEMQSLLFSKFIDLAYDRRSFKKIKNLLSNKTTLKGLTLDLPNRWSMIYKLNQFAVKGSKKLARLELQRDPSSFSRTANISTQVAYPSIRNKEKWLSIVTNPKSKLSLSQKRTILNALFPSSQNNIKRFFIRRLSKIYLDIAKRNDNLFAVAVSNKITLVMCNNKSTTLISNLLQNKLITNVQVRKNLMLAFEQNQRCMRIRQFLLKIKHRPPAF